MLLCRRILLNTKNTSQSSSDDGDINDEEETQDEDNEDKRKILHSSIKIADSSPAKESPKKTMDDCKDEISIRNDIKNMKHLMKRKGRVTQADKIKETRKIQEPLHIKKDAATKTARSNLFNTIATLYGGLSNGLKRLRPPKLVGTAATVAETATAAVSAMKRAQKQKLKEQRLRQQEVQKEQQHKASIEGPNVEHRRPDKGFSGKKLVDEKRKEKAQQQQQEAGGVTVNRIVRLRRKKSLNTNEELVRLIFEGKAVVTAADVAAVATRAPDMTVAGSAVPASVSAAAQPATSPRKPSVFVQLKGHHRRNKQLALVSASSLHRSMVRGHYHEVVSSVLIQKS